MISFDYLDNLFEPALVAHSNGGIIYFNASFLMLFKTTPRVMKKQENIREFLSLIIPGFSDFYAQALAGKDVISSELSFVFEGMNCAIVIRAIKNESDEVTLFFKDVTVEKQLNEKYRTQVEELKNSYSQLLQFDKLKTLGEMTANISHEINNPLTIAAGNTELISFALKTEDINNQRDKIAKYNTNINNSLDRITKIIRNMKEFLHKTEEKKEYCNAKEIIDRSVGFTTPSLKNAGVKINVNIDGNAPILLVNKIKIEQVLVNLIQNAVDSLRESNTKNSCIDVSIFAEKSGNLIMIDVLDNGPGISPENRQKIFQAFFTTKEVGKGTGLGLSISNQIIESHQGKLELLESVIGAHFRIILPAIGIAGMVNGDWEKGLSSGGQVRRILVIDDDINMLNLCMSFLSETDYFFMGVSSTSEALKEMERASINLIITNLKTSKMDGESFVRELREKSIDTPVLVMTGKESIEKYRTIKDELLLNGMIIKPFSKDEFVGAISAIVDA